MVTRSHFYLLLGTINLKQRPRLVIQPKFTSYVRGYGILYARVILKPTTRKKLYKRERIDDNKDEAFARRLSLNNDVLVFRDQDAVDRLRGHNSLVVGHRQVSQHAESRSQSVIFLLVI